MLKKIEELTPADIASVCDHTFLLRSEAFRKEAKQGESPIRLREKAFLDFLNKTKSMEYKPYAVCVRPEDVAQTAHALKETGIKIASAVGFPDGSNYSTAFKVSETLIAVENGATEIDMVLNYDKLKHGQIGFVKHDINAVLEAADDAVVKLILETSELNTEEIILACRIAVECNIPFIKTSTGFSAYGAKADDLKIMKQHFKRGIKISGGVTKDNVKELLTALSDNGLIELEPMKIRIGESSLL